MPALAGNELRDAVAGARWYHTLELPGGVTTPGEYDLRDLPRLLPLPQSLAGVRCLDVGVRDGFWAFTMEARGAEEIVGIDLLDPARLDWPAPRPPLTGEVAADLEARARTFETAAAALGSRVERRDLSVYDLAPGSAGTFRFAVLGTLLLHLRDPVGALMAVRSVLEPDGRLLVNEPIWVRGTLLHRRPASLAANLAAPFWNVPNLAGLRRYVEAAGFEVVEHGGPYLVPNGPGYRKPRLARPRAAGIGIVEQLLLRRGMPHAWVLARPR